MKTAVCFANCSKDTRKSRNCWRRNRIRNGRTGPSLKTAPVPRSKSLNHG